MQWITKSRWYIKSECGRYSIAKYQQDKRVIYDCYRDHDKNHFARTNTADQAKAACEADGK